MGFEMGGRILIRVEGRVFVVERYDTMCTDAGIEEKGTHVIVVCLNRTKILDRTQRHFGMERDFK